MKLSNFVSPLVGLRWAVAVSVSLYFAAFCFVSSPVRSYVPTFFGMTEIAPGLYTDDTRYTDHILDAVAEGEKLAKHFFGQLQTQPWLIVCTTSVCDRTFGTQGRALAYKDQFILVGHEGIHSPVLAHELVHVELYGSFRHTHNGPNALPAWLNEGLATFISGDDRPTQFVAQDALWVLEAHALADWHQLVHDNSWKDTYGAAQSVISGLSDSLGRDGLVELIASIQSGDVSDNIVQETIQGQRSRSTASNLDL